MPDSCEQTITLRQPSLVVLCGVSASGKSTFAHRNFQPTQIVSSDHCRAMLSDDLTDQRVSGRAFELFHWLIEQRLQLGRVTVADSTALMRKPHSIFANLADELKAQKILVLFDVDIEECLRRDTLRDHPVGEAVIMKQMARLQQTFREVSLEAWDEIVIIEATGNIPAREVRFGLFDLRAKHGPFDIIGDLHGCTLELRSLIEKLGYKLGANGVPSHPDDRILVFLGDLGDRGPDNAGAFATVMNWVEAGVALYTPGNHCNKLMRYLQGRRVKPSHDLDLTIRDVEAREQLEPGFKARLERFISSSPPYLWLDDGSLVVAHGGIKEGMIGRDDPRVQTMCLYGDVIGRNNPDGTPIRLDWAEGYHGKAAIIYGHTPVKRLAWRNNTINIDQGCVFGGRLTALRWPERETVQVDALETYAPGKDMS